MAQYHGNPPSWIKTAEIPWLDKCHRVQVAIASDIRGHQMAGEDVSVRAYILAAV